MGALTSNRKQGNDFPSFNYETLVSNSPNFAHIPKKPKFSLNETLIPLLPVESTVQKFLKYPDPINPIRREVHGPCKNSRFGSKFNSSILNYNNSVISAPEMGNLLKRKFDDIKRSTLDFVRCFKNDKDVIDSEEVEARVCDKSDLVGHWKETDGYVEIRRNGLDSLRCFKNDEEVIEIEEMEARVCNRSDLFGQKWKETDGFEEIKRNNNTVIDIDDDDDTVEECGSEDSSIEQLEAEGCEKSDHLDQKWKETEGFVEILDGKDSSDVTVGWDDGTSKEVSVGKKLDSLDSNPTSYSIFYGPLYRRLLGSVEKITQKLKRVHFQIGFHEKHLETHRLLRPQKKGEHVKEDLSKEAFVPLTEEEEAEISRALHISNRRKVLVTHVNSNIDITGEVLQCLRPKQWLNDEVINVYLELLKEREKREPQKFLKCHFFSTFFYKKLISGRGGYNYQSLRRWTSQKKLGYSLFDCEKIFVPIHREIHWCLAVINKKDKKFQYLDSLRGRDTQVLKVLARYFVDEVKDKSGKDIDVRSWKQEFVEDLPEQKNGFDCGVFMVKYADFYSRDVGLCFNQEHMPYFRLRTAKEILRLKAN